MQNFRDKCFIAGILQLTIGFVAAPPCIISGVITLAVALVLTINAKKE